MHTELNVYIYFAITYVVVVQQPWSEPQTVAGGAATLVGATDSSFNMTTHIIVGWEIMLPDCVISQR